MVSDSIMLDDIPLSHEQNSFVRKDPHRRQTREAEQRQDEEEQTQSVLEAGNVICDVIKEEAAEYCEIRLEFSADMVNH